MWLLLLFSLIVWVLLLKIAKEKKRSRGAERKKNTDFIYLKDFPDHAKLACDPFWPYLAGTGQRCLRVTGHS